MDNARKIEILKELKERLLVLNPAIGYYMCLELIDMRQNDVITSEEELLLVEELWADIIKEHLREDCVEYLNTPSQQRFKVDGTLRPFWSGWYNDDNIKVRLLNIDTTIKRLQDA